ncbi:MAG: hypothetical protein NUV67_03315 [archaeon]|nr:hypothetical protein [archaeon]
MQKSTIDTIFHLAILLALVGTLIGILMFTGILGCNAIPGACEIYYQVFRGGAPSVLIAYGEGGLGNHEQLEQLMGNRDYLGVRAQSMPLERLSYGNVNEYDLIIVEEAKKICSSKLQVFQSYVNSGGRLVWTGDSGTELCDGDELLLDRERNEGGSDAPLGPWARKQFGKQLSFDEFLGVNYKANYCGLSNCVAGVEAGRIEVTDSQHKLVYGLSPSIKYEGDFAIIEINKGTNSRLVATLDYGTNFVGTSPGYPWLAGGEKYDFGKTLPFIVSNQVGERVAYYAAPPEMLVNQKEPYKAILEQMYYGLLYN